VEDRLVHLANLGARQTPEDQRGLLIGARAGIDPRRLAQSRSDAKYVRLPNARDEMRFRASFKYETSPARAVSGGSLLSFFSNFYDIDDGTLKRTRPVRG